MRAPCGRAREAAAPVLAAQAISARRGARPVLHGVSVALQPGEWVAVVGPNGAGKSTLLSVLGGLLPATAGAVALQGRPLAQWPARQRAQQMAWLAQQGEAEGDLPVAEVVRLGRVPHQGLWGWGGAGGFWSPGAGLSKADEAAVTAAMQEADCVDLAQRRLSELSGGERQRVLLARTLAVQAPVLLLDEPTAHLDAPHHRLLLRSLRRLADGGGAAAVVLHDLTLALSADRVWLLDAGRLVCDAKPADPALHRALSEVFGGALAIERLERDGRVHHLARPLV